MPNEPQPNTPTSVKPIDMPGLLSQAAELQKSIICIQTEGAPAAFTELTQLLEKRINQLLVFADTLPKTARNEEAYLKLVLANLTEIINTARHSRRELVVKAVQDGKISRIEAGRILGVHQSTVAQWVKEDTQIPDTGTG